MNERLSNTYYTYLFSAEGVETIDTVSIGVPMVKAIYHDWAFSPSGEKLAIYSSKDDLRIFDFDRCSGALSNAVHVAIQDTADLTMNPTSGCAWSHDGRYLYTTNRQVIYKFDFWDSNWTNTYEIIAEYDGYVLNNTETAFGFMETAPDGRIYCKPTSGSARRIHTIWNPERSGVACDVRQHYYETPYPIANFPMFPNYRLGPIDNSACDTLGLDNHPLAGFRYDRLGGLAVDFTEVSWYEPDTWSWDFGDPNSGAANTINERYPTHVFSHSGYFTVCLTVSNQYGSDTVCKDFWLGTTGISDVFIEKNADYLLFPNPTENLVHWRITQENSQNKTVKQVLIYDATGRLVRTAAASGQSVELFGLPSGLYRLVALDGENGVLFSGNVGKL